MMRTPVIPVILMKMHAVLSLLAVGVLHICSLTRGIFTSFVHYVGFLTEVLLVPQLKTTLISEGKLALSGRKTMTFDRVK